MASGGAQPAMGDANKKDLLRIQDWFLRLSIVSNEDLHKLIPDLLPKLLFKLNNAKLHSKVQTELLSMLSHITSRIKGHASGHSLIPIAALCKML